MDDARFTDLFESLGPIRTRRMFGGTGIYAEGVMFALEAYGEIYLKADAEAEPRYRAAGSHPFVYEKEGKRATMSYWRIPDAALDDPEEAGRWGRIALDAARRAAGRQRR